MSAEKLRLFMVKKMKFDGYSRLFSKVGHVSLKFLDLSMVPVMFPFSVGSVNVFNINLISAVRKVLVNTARILRRRSCHFTMQQVSTLNLFESSHVIGCIRGMSFLIGLNFFCLVFKSSFE